MSLLAKFNGDVPHMGSLLAQKEVNMLGRTFPKISLKFYVTLNLSVHKLSVMMP